MTNRLEIDRRQFGLTAAAVGGGLAISLNFTPEGLAQSINPQPFAPIAGAGGTEINAWMVIAPDNTVVIRVAKTEMGNGAMTAMPLMICEELECDWTKVKVEYADANRNVVENQVYKSMSTGGSQSVRTSREYLQLAGASARERLKAAAAQQWNVPVADIEAKNSVLTHKPTGRKLTYGEIAAKAAVVRLEKEPAIKTPDQYVLMGKANVARFDTPAKSNGSAVFGMDIRLPGMLTGVAKHSPVHGGKVKSFDFAAIKDRPGVKAAIQVGGQGNERSGVVVVAETFWHAKTALDLLPIEWDDGDGAKFDTATIYASAYKALEQPGAVGRKEGDVATALKGATKTIEATYLVPYLDHATMEPLNATAKVSADRVDVWLGSQNADGALAAAANKAGVPPSKAFMYNAYLGGGFGRGGGNEPMLEAITASKALGGVPVHVIWTREETTRQGQYRPMAAARFEGGVGPDGMPTAYYARVTGDSRAIRANPAEFAKTGVDTGTTGNIQSMPYAIPNIQVEFTPNQTHLRLGAFRAPSANVSGFQLESFIDELAFAGGKDPAELRRALLRNAKDPGWLKVLNDLSEKSGWGKKTFPKGTAQGMALVESHGTIFGEVATVQVSPGGEVKVLRVDVSFDSGYVVNKSDVEAQTQGSIAMALTATLYGEMNIRRGRVVEGNFDDYQMLRIDEMPHVEVSYGGLAGNNKWGGLGEPAVPPLFPAVANAIFRATGKRIRTLPLKNHDLSWS